MSSSRAYKTSSSLERRLDGIRGKAPERSRTIRVLAAFAQHTDCNLARLEALPPVLISTDCSWAPNSRSPFGQSPFAYSRGLAFERILRDRNYALTLELSRTDTEVPDRRRQDCQLTRRISAVDSVGPLRSQDTRALLKRISSWATRTPRI